ncbi:MAG: hypothetical protein QXP81_10490, partial [Nitrososphaerota archaeon]
MRAALLLPVLLIAIGLLPLLTYAEKAGEQGPVLRVAVNATDPSCAPRLTSDLPVRLEGGEWMIGPSPDGRFDVRAELPYGCYAYAWIPTEPKDAFQASYGERLIVTLRGDARAVLAVFREGEQPPPRTVVEASGGSSFIFITVQGPGGVRLELGREPARIEGTGLPFVYLVADPGSVAYLQLIPHGCSRVAGFQGTRSVVASLYSGAGDVRSFVVPYGFSYLLVRFENDPECLLALGPYRIYLRDLPLLGLMAAVAAAPAAGAYAVLASSRSRDRRVQSRLLYALSVQAEPQGLHRDVGRSLLKFAVERARRVIEECAPRNERGLRSRVRAVGERWRSQLISCAKDLQFVLEGLDEQVLRAIERQRDPVAAIERASQRGYALFPLPPDAVLYLYLILEGLAPPPDPEACASWLISLASAPSGDPLERMRVATGRVSASVQAFLEELGKHVNPEALRAGRPAFVARLLELASAPVVRPVAKTVEAVRAAQAVEPVPERAEPMMPAEALRAAPVQPEPAPEAVPAVPEEVEPDPARVLELLSSGRRIRAYLPPQVVGAVALRAPPEAFMSLLDHLASGDVTVVPADLPEGIYFPDERLHALLISALDPRHLACALASALGGDVEADDGGRPSGRRVATWSAERALELSSELGLPAYRVDYLPELLACRLLPSLREGMGPRELRMAVGLSLLLDGLPDALAASGSLREAVASCSPCRRHPLPRPLMRGLIALDPAALASMEAGRAAMELRVKLGLRGDDAQRFLSLLLEPLEPGSLEPVPVSRAAPARALSELGREALRLASEGDRDGLVRLLAEVGASGVRDDRPSEPGVYYPEGDAWVLEEVARHAGREHLACLVALSLAADSALDRGGRADQLAGLIGSGGLIATASRERARELSSALGAEARGVDVLAPTAGRVLAAWAAASLPPNPELLLVVTSASLFYTELPDALAEVDARELPDSLAFRIMGMRPCHRLGDELRRAIVQAVRLASVSAGYAAVRQEVGELARLLYLRRPGRSGEAVQTVSPTPWLRVHLHPGGYYELEVDADLAPLRAAVQLGDGARYELPPRFPVRSRVDVVPLEQLQGRARLHRPTVILVARQGHGLSGRTEMRESCEV